MLLRCFNGLMKKSPRTGVRGYDEFAANLLFAE
jgi:hypothetical protein